jgi:lysophospholipase L1-like esterase
LEKPENVLRIVGVGDSWMWGSGVDNGETYLDRLQERLTGAGLRVETINTGVWGYNAVQQVATLRWKGLGFRPDVVVVGLCGNDRAYPDFVALQPFVELSRSFLWNEIRGHLDSARKADRNEPSRTLNGFMSHAAFRNAYEELAGLSQKEGFDVVVFSECFGVNAKQRRFCSLGTEDEWRDFLGRLDRWGFHRCPWNSGEIPQNYPKWGHATAEGNRMLAEVLEACVRPLLDKRSVRR